MEILNYSEQSPTGNTVAIFSLAIPAFGMTFHKLRLVRTKKGGLMVFFPSYGEPKEDGTKAWHSYVDLSENRRHDFNKKVMEALQPFLRGNDFIP